MKEKGQRARLKKEENKKFHESSIPTRNPLCRLTTEFDRELLGIFIPRQLAKYVSDKNMH